MRHLFIILSVWILCQSFFAESYTWKEIPCGKKYSDGSFFGAREILFPLKVKQLTVLPDSNLLVIEMTSPNTSTAVPTSGQLAIYDLSHNKILWTKQINPSLDRIFTTNESLIVSSLNVAVAYNLFSGDQIWKSKKFLYDVFPAQQIALVRISGKIGAIGLNDGNKRWVRKISDRNGINDLFFSNDSTLMLVSEGLHSIDTRTGEGWDLKMKTSKKDYAASIVLTTLNVLISAATGEGYATVPPSQYTDLGSNVCYDGNIFYLADKEKLVAVNELGSCLWQFHLPKRQTTKSTLFANDKELLLLNRGYAFEDGNRTDIGLAYLAGFDKESGQQIYFSKMEKGEMVIDHVFHNDEIALLDPRKILSYSMTTGERLSEYSLALNKDEVAVRFAPVTFCKQLSDSVWNNLVDTKYSHYFIITNQSRVIELDKEFRLVNFFSESDFYNQYFDTPEYRLISKDYKTIVIDNNGRSVAELPTNSQSFVAGNSIFTFENNIVRVINIETLIGKRKLRLQ